jgi:hypothetical protein
MASLYGSRKEYERQIRAKLDELVDQRFLLPQDRDLMLSSNR